MPNFTKSFRVAVFALMATVALSGGTQVSMSADMRPMLAPSETSVPALSAVEYLDRYAQLLLLRERFGAILESEVPDLMRAKLESFDSGSPPLSEIVSLRNDLTAELYYYAVNLKYLILAEGAIWPSDRSASTYRNDALSALSEITGELASGDVLTLDTDHLLHRLEAVNAWTEGVREPVGDWFEPGMRQRLVDDTLKAGDLSN